MHRICNLKTHFMQFVDQQKVIQKRLTVEINVCIYDSTILSYKTSTVHISEKMCNLQIRLAQFTDYMRKA